MTRILLLACTGLCSLSTFIIKPETCAQDDTYIEIDDALTSQNLLECLQVLNECLLSCIELDYTPQSLEHIMQWINSDNYDEATLSELIDLLIEELEAAILDNDEITDLAKRYTPQLKVRTKLLKDNAENYSSLQQRSRVASALRASAFITPTSLN